MNKRIMIALGGNAIKKPHERGTVKEQMKNVITASKQIAGIVRMGYDVLITHGNGPQVGNLAIQQEHAQNLVPPQPLVILGSMTQGQIGYMIQQNLKNLLRDMEKEVVTVVTQVLVDRKDPDFLIKSKPVGPFYSEEEAKRLEKENNWTIRKVRPNSDKRWRRVVPSPMPLRIIEGKSLKKMVDEGMIVIASGGGGIPVIYDNEGFLHGVDAVIDKDRAGEILSEEVGADIFLILTDVDHVMLDYGKATEKPIKEMNLTQAKGYLDEGHFLPGSMGPKVEAGIKFIEYGGKLVIISSLENAIEALEGISGTTIINI